MKTEIRLAERNVCTGCAVCVDICALSCIKMVRDDEGFLYPEINREKCVGCGKCMKACTALNSTDRKALAKLYAAWMHDEKKIQNSTSGGIFQGLAESVIDRGGVVFGAAFDDSFYLAHRECESLEKLPMLLGSKYLQSDTSGIYKMVDAVAKDGRTVLFSGTPCQCDALKRYYIANNKEILENIIVCEIMCHGVPSPGIFGNYVDYLEKKKKILKYNFRDKSKYGWDKRLCVCIEYIGGHTVKRRVLFDAWHSWFGAHLSMRPSCFECKYRDVIRVGDITIGDFWSIDKVKPDMDTKNGMSAMFVNTDKGFKAISEFGGGLHIVEIEKPEIKKLFRVPITKGAVPLPEGRDEFMRVYQTEGVEGLMKKYPAQTFFGAVIGKIKRLLKR